jgi:hypothetical protein
MRMVFNAMLDMMELQKGEEVFNDPDKGILHYTTKMYNFSWTIRFTVMEISSRRCGVRLGIDETGDNEAVDNIDEKDYLEGFARRLYAILDSMLLIGTPFELTYDN